MILLELYSELGSQGLGFVLNDVNRHFFLEFMHIFYPLSYVDMDKFAPVRTDEVRHDQAFYRFSQLQVDALAILLQLVNGGYSALEIEDL